MTAARALRLLSGALLLAMLISADCPTSAQQSAEKSPASNQFQSKSAGSTSKKEDSTAALKHDFIAAMRAGDTEKFLSYISAGGANVGEEAQHETRAEIEQQMQARRGLYCRLFDSSCLDAPIKLDDSARVCSYREALTHSPAARVAASEMVRNGVHQAVLVAQVHDEQCPGIKLIDFIFNEERDGWKLFSIP